MGAIDDTLRATEEMLQLLHDRLLVPQDHMKYFADKHHTERVFEVGDMVLLNIQAYRQTSLVTWRPQKLVARFYRPFRVLQCISTMA